MTQTLEQRAKIFYNCQVDPSERPFLRGYLLKLELATITDANFGKYPSPGPLSTVCPVGLNLAIAYQSHGSEGTTYTEMDDIAGLMDSLDAQRLEHLVGKRVVAYLKGQRLMGLSSADPK